MRRERTVPIVPVNAPRDSWWVCADDQFAARLKAREADMRLSKLGQQESPAYAPSVHTHHRKKIQEI